MKRVSFQLHVWNLKPDLYEKVIPSYSVVFYPLYDLPDLEAVEVEVANALSKQ